MHYINWKLKYLKHSVKNECKYSLCLYLVVLQLNCKKCILTEMHNLLALFFARAKNQIEFECNVKWIYCTIHVFKRIGLQNYANEKKRWKIFMYRMVFEFRNSTNIHNAHPLLLCCWRYVFELVFFSYQKLKCQLQ